MESLILSKGRNFRRCELLFFPLLVFALLIGVGFVAEVRAIPLHTPNGRPEYVGSGSCRLCHAEIYSQWALTPHARMLQDAKKNSNAVRATFTPDIPFTKDQVFFTIGVHWVQKYMTVIDGQYYVLPKYWNVREDRWEPYSIFNWDKEPYTETCLGCHTIGFDPETETYAEEGIGCESCHGPGFQHAKTQDPDAIVNPAKLDKVKRDMICEACHTDGKDQRTGKFPFPVGFKAGENIRDYYTDFFLPKPRSELWYLGDGSYLDRHRMFLFYQSKFYATDRACDVCGFDRGISDEEGGYMTRSQYCGTCHKKVFAEYFQHAQHRPIEAECTDCHVPKVTADGQRYSIHDHKFDFSQPEIPCSECHGDVSLEGKEEPKWHTFYFGKVKIPKNLSLEEACLSCHPKQDQDWVITKIDSFKSSR